MNILNKVYDYENEEGYHINKTINGGRVSRKLMRYQQDIILMALGKKVVDGLKLI